jgi:hypothetical protein
MLGCGVKEEINGDIIGETGAGRGDWGKFGMGEN